MKTYLVTGGAGFIGSNFIRFIMEKHKQEIKVINVDSLTYAGNLENLSLVQENNNYIFVKADVCDSTALKTIFSCHDIDYVVNFAAESHVDRSIAEPEIFISTNVMGTQTLLNAAKDKWSSFGSFLSGKKFIQISTDEVYGSLGDKGYFTEATPVNPHSPYSASKAAADLLVKAYTDTYNMPVNIMRCCNNYGPCQFPEKFIPLIINNVLNKKSIPVYGDGKNIREWLYVEDHCKAIDIVISHGKPGEVYNIGGNTEKQNIEIVHIVIEALKQLAVSQEQRDNIDKSAIKYIEDRKGHDRRYSTDFSKISRELGWYPETKFEDGISVCVKWYLDNPNWLLKVTSGEYMEFYNKMYTCQGNNFFNDASINMH